jgi:filamentous hemagglutinin family protein
LGATCSFACLSLLVAAIAGATQELVVRDDTLGAGRGETVAPGVDPFGRPADYLITPDLGRQVGSNLFHSFLDFGVGEGEVATFAGPDPVGGPQSVANILARVTGGRRSEIDGTLRSTIDGASLYVLNPAGVLFGPNARLDLKGAFHVTTADFLRFTSGETFDAYLDGAVPVLSFAEPMAFGFLDHGPSSPGSLRFAAGSELAIPHGERLSAIGGDIHSQGHLLAPGGSIGLVSVASGGEVAVDALHTAQDSFSQLGALTLSAGSVVDTSGVGGGEVVLRGGRLELVGPDTRIHANTLGDVDGNGVDIAGDHMVMSDDASIRVETHGGGAGGRIALDLQTLALHDRAEIFSGASESGAGAGIDVAASESIVLSGPRDPNQPRPRISTETSGLGSGGAISFATPDLALDAARVSTLTLGPGQGGAIDIDAANVKVEGGSRLVADTHGTGFSGRIAVNASESVSLSGVPDSEAFTFLQSFLVSWSGHPTATTPRDDPAGVLGDSGGVEIHTRHLSIDDLAVAGSLAWGNGNSGDVTIDVARLEMVHNGQIGAGTNGSGRGGNLVVSATDSIFISGGPLVPPPFGNQGLAPPTGISNNTFTTGDAGNIRVSSPLLHLDDNGVILSLGGAFSPLASGGAITVDVGTLLLTRGGNISAGTFGAGDAGTVTVTATESISMSGRTPQGSGSDISSSSGPLPPFFSGGDGKAGSVVVTTPKLTLDEFAAISSEALTGGNAGSVVVEVGTLDLGGRISARTAGGGDSGSVTVRASEAVRATGGTFEASAADGGTPGVLTITAPTVELDHSSASAQNAGLDDGGNLTIEGTDLLTARASEISASAEGGTGGNVTLRSNGLVALLDATRVTASAPGGQGGRIEIASQAFIRSGDTVLDASGGSAGGEVVINAPEQVVIGQVAPLPTEFLDASSMMLASCAARRTGERAGSFTVARWRGLPLSPEGPLLAFEPIGSLPATDVASQDSLPPVAAAPTDDAEEGEAIQLAYAALVQGDVAMRSGSLERASTHWQEASDIAAEAGNDPLAGDALRGLAQAEQLRGEYAASIAPLEDALERARRSGDPAREAAALGSLGDAYLALREPALASQYLDEALAVARRSGDPSLAATLHNNRGRAAPRMRSIPCVSRWRGRTPRALRSSSVGTSRRPSC